MQKLIPTIYFYVLSLVGMIILIIGLFNTIHYLIGVTMYDTYPLRYGTENRCSYLPASVAPDEKTPQESKAECLLGLEAERERVQADDLEKAISFTLIGAVVFGLHFYFARRTRRD